MPTEFPVVEGDSTTHPAEPLCPRCREAKVFEPHSFAVLSGGASLVDDDERSTAAVPDGLRLNGGLDLTWHGAHEDSGVGSHRDIYEVLPIALDVEDGRFEIYFCSTTCLRGFLNDAVDTLELRMESAERDA